MLVNTAMNQEPVKENIPYSWSKLAQIKSDHYKALAHYFIATILCDHECKNHTSLYVHKNNKCTNSYSLVGLISLGEKNFGASIYVNLWSFSLLKDAMFFLSFEKNVKVQ